MQVGGGSSDKLLGPAGSLSIAGKHVRGAKAPGIYHVIHSISQRLRQRMLLSWA